LRGAVLLAAIAVVAVVPAACTPDFDDEAIVKDLRVLGVSADRPEVLFPGGPVSMQPMLCPDQNTIVALVTELMMRLPESLPIVTLRPAVVDPQGGGRPVHYRAVACVSPAGTIDEPGGGNMMPGGVRQTIGRGACPDNAPALGEGDAAPPANAVLAPIEIQLPLTREILLAAFQQDFLGIIYGLPLTVQVTVTAGGEQAVVRKRVLLATELIAGQAPNRNPVVTAVSYRSGETGEPKFFDLTDPQAAPPTLRLGEKLRLEPFFDGKEAYPTRVGDRTTGCVHTEQTVEAVRFAFFATAGHLDPPVTNTEPPVFREPGNNPHRLETEYEAPKALLPGESDLVRVWVVARDERAGSSFVEVALRLVN
jgi:hypothetical protein